MLSAALTWVVSACSSSSESDPKPTQEPEMGELGITMEDLEQDRWTEKAPLRLKDTLLVVETTFQASSDPWNGYSGSYAVVDLEPIYTAFAMSELQFLSALNTGTVKFVAIEPGGSVVTEYTANNYGYWYDAAGYVCQHGNSAAVAVETEDFSVYNVAQYPGALSPGASYAVQVGFVYVVEEVTYTATIKINVNIMKKLTAADFEVAGALQYNINISRDMGYHGEPFMVDGDKVCEFLGITKSEFGNKLGSTCTLVPLNADGTDAENTAGADFGGWFDNNGTVAWGNGDLTFLEIGARDPFNFSNGCHDSHVNVGDKVTMRMQYRNMENLKACNIVVNATIVD